MGNSYKILGRKFEGKMSLERQRSRWDDNVNMVQEGVWLESVYWIYLLKIWSTYRLLCKRCWNFGLLKKCQNVLTSWSNVTFWRRVLPFGVVLKYYVALVWIGILCYGRSSQIYVIFLNSYARGGRMEGCMGNMVSTEDYDQCTVG